MTPTSKERTGHAVVIPQNFHATKTPPSLCIRRDRLLFIFSLIATLLIAAQHSNLLAITPVTEVVVETGDPAPDGDGTFSNYSVTAALNNHGWAGFRETLNNTARGYGLFLGNGSTLIQVARITDPAPAPSQRSKKFLFKLAVAVLGTSTEASSISGPEKRT